MIIFDCICSVITSKWIRQTSCYILNKTQYKGLSNGHVPSTFSLILSCEDTNTGLAGSDFGYIVWFENRFGFDKGWYEVVILIRQIHDVSAMRTSSRLNLYFSLRASGVSSQRLESRATLRPASVPPSDQWESADDRRLVLSIYLLTYTFWQ